MFARWVNYTPPVQPLPVEANATILVVRLGALGDILRTLPAVRLIRAGLPGASIRWLVDDRWRMALDGLPELDGIVAVPRREWQRLLRTPAGWPAWIGSFRRLRRELRGVDADLVVDFHGNLRSGLLGRLSAAPTRLGYSGHQAKEANRWFTTHRVPSGSRRTPRIERNLDLVRALGLPDAPLPLGKLPLAERGRAKAAAILGALPVPAGGYAVINPGSSTAQAYKRPPAELLAAAAAAVERRGLLPLVVWGPGEEEEARRVVELSEGKATLAPPTDLEALAALIEGASLFVSGDSGPLHMACLLGRPVVALYGATDPQVNGPWGAPSRAVFPDRTYSGFKRQDREGAGLEAVTPEQLTTAVASLLDECAS
jgi:ADP-heptose:LPS heptosyltransferase